MAVHPELSTKRLYRRVQSKSLEPDNARWPVCSRQRDTPVSAAFRRPPGTLSRAQRQARIELPSMVGCEPFRCLPPAVQEIAMKAVIYNLSLMNLWSSLLLVTIRVSAGNTEDSPRPFRRPIQTRSNA